MGLKINHNVAAYNSWRNLQSTDQKMSKTLERLSSGSKLNRAADGPANLVIAEQMKAQIKSMEQVTSNSELAISMVQTAEASMNEVNNILVNMRQLSLHAANEGANDDKMLAADQQEIENSLRTLNGIAKQAQFGSRKLLNGSNGISGVAIGENVKFIRADVLSQSSPAGGYDINISEVATRARIEGSRELSQQEVDLGGVQITLHEGGKSITYYTQVGETMETMMENLKQLLIQSELALDVGLTAENHIYVEHREYGSEPSFGVMVNADGILGDDSGSLQESVQGTDVQGTIGGELAHGDGQYLTAAKGTKAEGTVIQYTGGLNTEPILDAEGNPVVDEEGNPVDPREISEGAVYITNNSLTFQVGPDQGQTSRINLPSVNTYVMSQGVKNESGYNNLSEIDVTTAQGAQDALALIDQSIYEITSARGNLGAFQKNTLETNLNNLRYATENMIAAESGIRDTDMASEMSEFTKQQILLASGTAMLGQANQTPKAVLNLLNGQ
ncbi:MAG: flagellin [Deltaproteobacteria bacterium]|nr:flagellin [Deltaproteobacteria bacterium]